MCFFPYLIGTIIIYVWISEHRIIAIKIKRLVISDFSLHQLNYLVDCRSVTASALDLTRIFFSVHVARQTNANEEKSSRLVGKPANISSRYTLFNYIRRHKSRKKRNENTNISFTFIHKDLLRKTYPPNFGSGVRRSSEKCPVTIPQTNRAQCAKFYWHAGLNFKLVDLDNCPPMRRN